MSARGQGTGLQGALRSKRQQSPSSYLSRRSSRLQDTSGAARLSEQRKIPCFYRRKRLPLRFHNRQRRPERTSFQNKSGRPYQSHRSENSGDNKIKKDRMAVHPVPVINVDVPLLESYRHYCDHPGQRAYVQDVYQRLSVEGLDEPCLHSQGLGSQIDVL